MRTIDEYMKLPYKMEIVPDMEEGGYVVSFPDLPGCLTIGDTVDEAIKSAEGISMNQYCLYLLAKHDSAYAG